MSGLPSSYARQAGEWSEAVASHLHSEWSEFCESPIETTFIVTMKLYLGMMGAPAVTIVNGEEYTRPDLVVGRKWFIEPQVRLGDYRVDFVIGVYPKQPDRMIIIECDGHDFHERTKEQAARDRSRDRFLQAAGYKVFRFTGTELHNRAFWCCDEVFRELLKWEDA